jgi:aminopeptidase N
VAHLWTQGAGPAANFLREGWATFAEALILREKFGPEVERRFWRSQAKEYFARSDGKASILPDPNNQGVAYTKGSWIFAMLEDVMGAAAFDQAMTDFSRRSLERPAGVEELIACLDRASGKKPGAPDAASFLMPWLREKSAPQLASRIEGNRILITQSGPLFELPVEIDIETPSGRERTRVSIARRETEVPAGKPVRSVVIDPDERFLLKR